MDRVRGGDPFGRSEVRSSLFREMIAHPWRVDAMAQIKVLLLGISPMVWPLVEPATKRGQACRLTVSWSPARPRGVDAGS